MFGPFTFTFTLESEEFENLKKWLAAADLYQTMITTRAPDGANKAVCVRFNKFGSSAGNREFDGKKLCETFLIKEKITKRNICSNKFSSGNSLRNG